MEERGTRLAGRRTLSDLVPFVRELEEKNILEEIKGKKLSSIFDGTTRMGEALAVLHFVNAEWDIKQRLIHLLLLTKSLTGDEVARELITILQVHYKVSAGSHIGAMHDRASENNVAMRTMSIIYPA